MYDFNLIYFLQPAPPNKELFNAPLFLVGITFTKFKDTVDPAAKK